MLEIKDLHFSYDNNVIFNGLSFSIKKREILCVVGKNGSGKTTLLKILSGLNYCPGLGCQLDGEGLNQNQLKSLVTYIPAAPNFYEDLSSEEYIYWVKALWGKKDPYLETVHRYMDLLDLDVDPNKEISSYSLGMKYKLYFSSSLALNHPILLLDEPLNSLDIESRELSISLIKDYIKKQDGYCLFSSHVKDTISNLANKVIRLS